MPVSHRWGRTVSSVHDVVVLAHQGGWDEILMVAGPVAIFVGLLRIARRRAEQLAEEQSAEELAQEESAEEPA